MVVTYRTKKLERVCLDARQMQREFGLDVARRLRRRLNALYAQPSIEAVRAADPQGKWHQLEGDMSGLWAADVSRNYRLEVEPGETGEESVMTVVRIEDYH